MRSPLKSIIRFIGRTRVLFFAGQALFCLTAHAQRATGYEDIPTPAFVKKEKVVLQNEEALQPFFDKLSELRHGKRQKVNVVHIGDSHLQAGFLPYRVARGFHERFCNGGPGLITPYKAAKTNEPPWYKTQSLVPSNARRIVKEKQYMPIGLDGVTWRTTTAGTVLSLALRNDYLFDRICFVYEKDSLRGNLVPADSSGSMFILKEPGNKQTAAFSDCFRLPHPVNSIQCRVDAKQDSIGSLLLYGLYLENQLPGVVYNTIAVNGAEYRHYTSHEAFFKQLTLLQPDLFILSLGTNEAYAKGFTAAGFELQVDSFLTTIQTLYPDAAILITGPGDALKGKKYKNANNRIASETLSRIAINSKCAFYNTFQIMGGPGSIQKWYAKGLTSRDKLHLNARGYTLQGRLLFEAIMKSYERLDTSGH